MLAFTLSAVWLVVAVSASLWGLDYYVLTPEERAYSPLAHLFSPTGLVGHGYGVVGTAMIVIGVVGYALRKRLRFLSRLGPLRSWLTVHIFLCTLGPFLVLLHTTFKFGGIVSIAFWSMAVVVVSGLFGRYVYVRIPKRLNGAFLGMDEAAREAEELASLIRDRAGLSGQGLEASALDALVGRGMDEPGGPAGPGSAGRIRGGRGGPDRLLPALAVAVREDVRGRARLWRVGRSLRAAGVPGRMRTELTGLVRERDRLRRQMLLLRPFQRLFRYWHVIHLPLAIVMFAVLAVHVAVAVLFGYTWVFR